MQTLLNIAVIAVAVFTLVKSASILEKGLVIVSNRFRVDAFVLGFVFLAVSTSLPEIGVAVFASNSAPLLAVGNLFGATTVLLTLIIGGAAVKFKNLAFSKKFGEPDILMGIFLIAMMLIMSLDKILSREEGIILVAGYFFYILFVHKSFQKAKVTNHSKNKINKFSSSDFTKIILSTLALILSAYFTVESAKSLANDLNVSTTLMGIVILAIGTNLPEITILAISKKTVKEESLALGNFFGSACVNPLVIGLLILINGGFTIPDSEFIALVPTVVICLLALFLFSIFSYTGHKLSRLEGLLLVGLYFSWIIVEILVLTNIF